MRHSPVNSVCLMNVVHFCISPALRAIPLFRLQCVTVTQHLLLCCHDNSKSGWRVLFDNVFGQNLNVLLLKISRIYRFLDDQIKGLHYQSRELLPFTYIFSCKNYHTKCAYQLLHQSLILQERQINLWMPKSLKKVDKTTGIFYCSAVSCLKSQHTDSVKKFRCLNFYQHRLFLNVLLSLD